MSGTMIRALLLLLVLCPPAIAEIIRPDPLIGRINHAGYERRSHCTGFLVEGGHLVTAAHCMPNAERSVHFLAGYDRAAFMAHIERPKENFLIVRGRDIAVLCNAVADRAGLPWLEAQPDPAEPVTILGYASPRSHVLQRKQCEVIRAARGEMRIGCPLAPGNSGGPVLWNGKVVGVVSATSQSMARAYLLEPRFLDACH